MKKIVVFLGIFLCANIIFSQENYVVLLSLDGFRYDYIEKFKAKNLQAIAEKGVRVKRLIPSNPTKTFPNHYTLVTGLYPDNHGLIGNLFYDKKLKKEYNIRDRKTVQNGIFYGGEPIWNTAKKAGLKTASYFWVGSEADINGLRPDIWKKYNHKVSFEQRIDSVISWLKLPKTKRPRLVTLYYHEPDKAGHHHGPDSKEVKEQIEYVDKQIGNLYKRLMQLPIAKQINFIIVSDHGMRKITPKKQIILYNYVDKEDILGVYGSNPVYSIRVKEGKADKVYKQLKRIRKLYVFRHKEAPKKLKLANHHRTNDFIVVGKKGYSVFKSEDKSRMFGGTHGYLNSDKQMSAVFVAIGNKFKTGFRRRKINNVDVYNLIAHILNIKPAKNDGNFNNVKPLLKE